MKWSQLKQAGHFPTLVTAFHYFDYSFMVWTLLDAQIAAPESLRLSAAKTIDRCHIDSLRAVLRADISDEARSLRTSNPTEQNKLDALELAPA